MKAFVFLLTFVMASCGLAADVAKTVSSTNGVVSVAQRVQCHSVTKSGNRCKRKAPAGKIYCRQHAAPSSAAKPTENCAYISDDGKRCVAPVAPGSRFCAAHKEK